MDAILCVSPLVRLEALVKPIVDGNKELVADYEIFLADQQWLTIGNAEFDRALSSRVQHRVKTPDALHLATAIQHCCAEFWTNDGRLDQVAAGMAVKIINLTPMPDQRMEVLPVVHTASVEEARLDVSRLLEAAERGETTVVTKDGRPIARVVPEPGAAGRRERLRMLSDLAREAAALRASIDLGPDTVVGLIRDGRQRRLGR